MFPAIEEVPWNGQTKLDDHVCTRDCEDGAGEPEKQGDANTACPRNNS